MKKAIIYSSLTGNTKKVAEKIWEVSDKMMEIFNVQDVTSIDSYEEIILGFWVDRGTADKKMLNLIERIKDKKVSFFATLGAYPDSDHAKKVIMNVTELLEKNNNKVDKTFICQGKVSDSLKERMKTLPKEHPHYPDEARLKRWADADKHPNEEDFSNAQKIFSEV